MRFSRVCTASARRKKRAGDQSQLTDRVGDFFRRERAGQYKQRDLNMKVAYICMVITYSRVWTNRVRLTT